MTESLKRVERRRCPRHRVQENAVAFYGKWPCSIVDISEVGMAVSCASGEIESGESGHLDIFLADAGFYLPQVPVNLVQAQPTLPRSMFSTLRFKRISLEFGPLSSEQRARIQDFIQDCCLAQE